MTLIASAAGGGGYKWPPAHNSLVFNGTPGLVRASLPQIRLEAFHFGRRPMISAQQTFTMLENHSLWDAAARCHEVLEAAGIPHAIVGGVAVCLHGYRRNTVDLDLLVPKGDAERIRKALEDAGFSWDTERSEFRSPGGIPIQFLLAADRAGKGSEVHLPDPVDPATRTEIEGLPVLTLARLIESKIACGEGDPRRTYKDFADVVELVAIHGLDGTFARHLHKSIRPTFRQLARRARGS